MVDNSFLRVFPLLNKYLTSDQTKLVAACFEHKNTVMFVNIKRDSFRPVALFMEFHWF